AISCIGHYWFSLEHIYYSLICYFLGLVGFWVSMAFYNSYLPDVANYEQQDAISAKGFSLGYIGSVILLLFNLAMVMKPGLFGLESDADGVAEIKAMKYSFITVGIWWMGFAQYTFYVLPKGYKKEGARKNIVLNGFKELYSVWQELAGQRRLKRYLGAFFVYSMALQTVMLIATYFGEEEIKWNSDSERTTGLIVSILLIQLVAVLGATLTAKASKVFGNIGTLIVINILWVFICVYAYFLITPLDFYIAAGCVGMVMGGIQALSRSTYSKFLPETTDTASFFSFYDVAEKIGIVIGTFLYGFVAQYSGSMRYAIILLGLFFLVGAFLLTRVNKGSSN
ncbi:MAG: MFS transporter, partial [Arenibacter sp.]|nr:MFS transporter [Arenibacter sp.]